VVFLQYDGVERTVGNGPGGDISGSWDCGMFGNRTAWLEYCCKSMMIVYMLRRNKRPTTPPDLHLVSCTGPVAC
jgi:hypothetical protein